MSTDRPSNEGVPTPEGAPIDQIVDAEFEEADGTMPTGEQAMVLAPQDVATELATLADSLKGHVPDEVAEKIGRLGQVALATVQRQAELETRLKEIELTQEARTRAAITLLGGGGISESGIAGEQKEKTPDKLRQLQIETPDSVELVTEKFTMTLTNPNGEEVQADVSVTLQSADGTEDPILECVVNPQEGRTSGLIQRPITLGPKERREIEVALRSRLGEKGDPIPENIIADKMKIDLKLAPTDVDSKLSERNFPAIYRHAKLNDTVMHQNEVELPRYNGYSCTFYPLSVEGLEFCSRDGYGKGYNSAIRLPSSTVHEWQNGTSTETFKERLAKVGARTQKGHIPLKLAMEVIVHLSDKVVEGR